MAILHLISGLPCSGKTTYSAALRSATNGVLFSLDTWLITTFRRYLIMDVGHEEHVRRVLACRDLIWRVGSEFLRRDVDVILDDGFFLRSDRVRLVDLSRQVGATARIHYLSTPLRVVQARLNARNDNLPPFNFWIGPETLSAFLALFEVPSEDEGAELVRVTSIPDALRPVAH